MKNQFLMILMLFTFGIANGQIHKFSISKTENTDFQSLENTNNNILNQVRGSETLVVSFQYNVLESISADFSKEVTPTGIKVVGKGDQFNSEFTLVKGKIQDGNFDINGTSYGIEINHTAKGDILYYYAIPDATQNFNTINVNNGYDNLTSFTSLSQSEDFLKLWGSEAQSSIAIASNIDLDPNAPIFWGAYDWHSSIEGHWASVYASYQLNDASYRAEAYSRYTESNIQGEKYYNPDINEELYGFQWLFMYADYLFHNDKTTFDQLKPMFDARYQQYLNGDYYPVRFGPNYIDGGYYYNRNLGSGYFNSNFGLNGAYLYAKNTNDTATAEHIKSFVTQYSADINWNNVYTEDFMDPATAALMIYTNIENTSGTGWDNLISYWNSRSLTIPSLSSLSSHEKGIYAFKTIGIWKMYEITNDEKFKTAYINHVNAIFIELKRLKSSSSYHYQIGHWIPNIMAIALKENLDGNNIIDTVEPTAPTNLASANITATSAEFNWTAATDNVAVKNYELFLNNALVATTTMTSATINNLQEKTNYTFAVSAVDDAENKSTLVTKSFTTLELPDTEAPSAPSGLTVFNIEQTSASFNWNSSTDNKGVAKYYIYLNNTLLGTTTNLNYSVSNLSPSSTYTISVKAEDLSGNVSSSSTTQFTTLEEVYIDDVNPSNVTNITASNITETSLSLNWNAATDNIAISHYDLYQDGQKIGNTQSQTFNVNSLNPGQEYTFGVIAFDTSGNSSNMVTLNVKTTSGDTESPTDIARLILYRTTEDVAIILWTKSSDNVKVDGYNVMVDGEKLYDTAKTFAVIPDLTASTTYKLGAVAYDEAGNLSNETNIDVTTLSGDSEAPTDIEFIVTTGVTSNSVSLVWSNSTDNVEVHEYEVYLNGNKYSSSNTTNTTLTGLSSGTTYTIGVVAKDKAGNSSNIKNISATTL